MNRLSITCNAENYGGKRAKKVKYIVVHYTANNGDTARGNGSYFQRTPGLYASAHWFVDEKEAVLSVPEDFVAWHCGGTNYVHPECRNSNSIGVELCSRRDQDGEFYFLPETVDNAVMLTRELMEKYNVPPERVIRHYDVTNKICPAPFVGVGIAEWKTFKELISMKRYNTVDELPTWARPTVQKLIDKGFLNGTDKGLDLTHDNVRMLVILDRAGVFDK